MTCDLVCLGNLIVDDVVYADGRTRMGEAGGAILYVSLGAALWGLRVAVVAPVGTDYPRATLDQLAARGIDLSYLRPLGRTGLRNWLLYEPLGRRIVHELSSPPHTVSSPNPDDLARGPAARAYHVAPMPLASQAALVVALADRGAELRTLDPHEPVDDTSLARWRPVLAGLDVLFVSQEEIALDGCAADDPARALAPLAGGRLGEIALKRGAGGGVWYDARTRAAVHWPARAIAAPDPTGAGDAFAGGVLAGRLAGLSLADSLTRGVVSASFAIEGWGAAPLFAATPAEAQRRFDLWRDAFVHCAP